jgi:hypothetical protein
VISASFTLYIIQIHKLKKKKKKNITKNNTTKKTFQEKYTKNAVTKDMMLCCFSSTGLLTDNVERSRPGNDRVPHLGIQ